MPQHLIPRLAAIAASAFLAAPLSAQSQGHPAPDTRAQACGLEPLILETAGHILDNRMDLPRFQPARFGGDALYLTLHYADPGPSVAVRMIDALAGQGRDAPRELDAVALPYLMQYTDLDTAIDQLGGVVKDVISPSASLLRAMLLRDQMEAFRARIEALPDDTETQNYIATWQSSNGGFISVLDQSDATKLALAADAEAQGFHALAAGILASRTTLDAYFELEARYADAGRTAIFTGSEYVASSGAMVWHQAEPGALVAYLPDNSAAERFDLYDTYRMGARQIGMAWASVFLNQTGKTQIMGHVARQYLAALDSGALGGEAELEQRWLFVWREIHAQMPHDAIFQGAQFDVTRRVRHYAARLPVTMDWIVAIDALGPLSRGETAALPARPAILGQGIDWDVWLSVATSVRLGVELPAEHAAIAVEMQVAAGDWAGAVATARRDLQGADRLYVLRDLMRRMDGRCAGHTLYPGSGLFLGGATLYRFDDPSQGR